MSKSEKRHFKLFSTAQKGNKSYLQLFNAIDAQDIYDEIQLKKKFERDKNFSQLAVSKNRLHSLILKNLSLYHSKRTVDFEVREALNQIEVLYFKGLYNQCLKIIDKEKKLCYTLQKYSLLLELVRWERKIRSFDIDNLQAVNLPVEEASNLLFKLSKLNDYQFVSLSEWMLSNHTGRLREEKDKDKFQKILLDPLLENEPVDIGWEAQWHYWYTFFTHHKVMGEYEKAFHAAKRSLDLFDTIPGLVHEEVHKYISSLNNVAIALQELNRVEECISYTTKLRSFIKHPSLSFYTTIHIRSYIFSYMIELDAHLKNKRIKDAMRIIPFIEEFFELNPEEFSEYYKVGTYLEIANVYFYAEDFKKSLFWINKTLNGLNDRLDLQPAARLMNIIINYELNNIYTMDALIASTQHFLKRNKRLYEYEKNILSKLKKLQFSNSKANEKKIMLEFMDSMQELLSDKYGKVALEYFDLPLWVEGKLEGKPILQLIEVKKKKTAIVQ
ncbi:MAG TPA: hypothetical protein VFF27_13145 [Bacteroidia bacterium]|nr:hypothetical protein [Bacteroidia bacterium]